MKNGAQKLSGKVAVVTGASKGIGAEIAKELAAEGASVVVNYASSKAGADKVVSEIAGSGGKAIAVQGDVAKRSDITRLFAETKRRLANSTSSSTTRVFMKCIPLRRSQRSASTSSLT